MLKVKVNCEIQNYFILEAYISTVPFSMLKHIYQQSIAEFQLN